jgi:uracil-DNA glycosylase
MLVTTPDNLSPQCGQKIPGNQLRMGGDVSEPELAGLVAQLRGCRICRDAPTRSILPHEPRPVVRVASTARIVICGQAPGVRVHNSGLPFDDPSGDRLRTWMGIDRAAFYAEADIAFMPMGFCFPGHDANKGDLPPRRECARAWRAPLLEQLHQVELMLLIGAHAQVWHLARRPDIPGNSTRDRPRGVTATVADWRRVYDGTSDRSRGPRLLVLPHPSWRNSGWLKRNPGFAVDLLPVLQTEVRRCLAGTTSPCRA